VEACIPRAGLLEVFPNTGKILEDKVTPLKASSAGRRPTHDWERFLNEAGTFLFWKGRPDSLAKFAKEMQQKCINSDWEYIPDLRTIKRKLNYLWRATE
jgi:hypothetical protein